MKAICLYQREIGIDEIYTACARISNESEYSQFLQRAREISQGENRPEHKFLFWDISYTPKEWKLIEASVNIPDLKEFLKCKNTANA